MTLGQIIRTIKKDTWWSEESPGNYQIIVTAWRCFVVQNQALHGKYLNSCIALYKNDFVYEKTSETEKLRQFYVFRNRYFRNPESVLSIYKKFRKIQKHFVNRGDTTIRQAKRYTNKELARAYLEIYRLAIQHYAHSVLPESGDVYTDRYLLRDLNKSFRDQLLMGRLSEIAITLSTYPMQSFMEKAHLAFLKLALQKAPNFIQYAKRYHWIQNNYLGRRDLTAAYFRREADKLRKQKSRSEIKEEIRLLERKSMKLKTEQVRLLKRYRLDQKTAKTFELLRLFSKWIDERKFGAMHMVYYLDHLANEIGRRTGLSMTEVGYHLPEELVAHLLHGIRVPKAELKARWRLSVYMTTSEKKPYKEYVFTGEKAKQIFAAFQKANDKSLHGFVASAPTKELKGVVQIILNPHTQKFIPGRILVTSMTRPDFAPYMRQAAGIITDEGGITSHAAIVSRELRIPCIIGTKIGTKALKDGDSVKLDLEKGTIVKI